MSSPIFCKNLDDYLDRKHLLECLEDAIQQINRCEAEIIISIGGVEIHADYVNDELFVVVQPFID